MRLKDPVRVEQGFCLHLYLIGNRLQSVVGRFRCCVLCGRLTEKDCRGCFVGGVEEVCIQRPEIARRGLSLKEAVSFLSFLTKDGYSAPEKRLKHQ